MYRIEISMIAVRISVKYVLPTVMTKQYGVREESSLNIEVTIYAYTE
jgi:hypothetical protein